MSGDIMMLNIIITLPEVVGNYKTQNVIDEDNS